MDPNLDSLKTSGDPWKSWQSSWDWLHLFVASYFDRCPCSSLLQRTGGPWKQLGVKKKNPTKTKQNPRACCHHYESREHKSTAQQTHQLSAEIFLLHAGFPSFVTFAQFNSRQVCKAQVSRIRGKLCQKSITRWQPKARFCMCPEQDGNVNARGSKAPLQGKQPLYKAHQAGSGSVPCESRSLIPQSSESGQRNQGLPAEHRGCT